MKKFYFALLLSFFTVAAFAQNNAAVANSCIAGDSVRIVYDYSMNCPAAPGSLAGMASIGFHAGGNQWSSVIDWNNANAKTAMNNGSDVFTVTIHPATYFSLAQVDNVYFVFNQGPADPNTPWGSEGKDDNGAGGCSDFSVVIANLAACATSTTEVLDANTMVIAPNPFSDRTSIRLDNANNETFNLTITSLTGQVVRTMNGIRNQVVEVERGDLMSGIYFVTLQNENGARMTKKLVVQ